MGNLKNFLLGQRYSDDNTHQTKVSKPVGLAVFSSDALSSVAYATQSIMDTISLAGPAAGLSGALLLGAFAWSWYAALGIVGLLIILLVSYNQTIRAYPSGGGAYLVARDNLGLGFSQAAGASLLVDYILTVAVSVSAGVSALTSAFPSLDPHRVLFASLVLVFVAYVNLIGVKESGLFFAVPTYGFVISILSLVALGGYRVASGDPYAMEDPSVRVIPEFNQFTGFAAVWLFARAYAAGCTALTGIEAISDGIQNFKPPAAENAVKTMRMMTALLGAMFLGITYLANHFHLSHHPNDPETLLSTLTKRILFVPGASAFAYYYYLIVQGFTMAILFLAANTAYADFPRLAALLAKDKYLPRQFSQQGHRLVFSNGIIILSVIAFILVWAFNAREHFLLDLYAFGVFLGFSISQGAMVVRWNRLKGSYWKLKLGLNALGFTAASLVLLVILATKFTHGVWAVTILIFGLVHVFRTIHKHYEDTAQKLLNSTRGLSLHRKNRVIVLVSGVHSGVVSALNYAKTIAPHDQIEALTVDLIDENGRHNIEAERLKDVWHQYGEGIPLKTIENRYRQIIGPIVHTVRTMRETEPECTITVIIPEFVTQGFVEWVLHNQTAFWIKLKLRAESQVIVISIPYHL
ncbi:MAG: APC family permease [Holophagaceae bacterium]